MDNICRRCLKRSKDEKWYPFSSVCLVPQKECSFHPNLDNWRVARTHNTMRAWSLEADGYSVALTMTAKMPCKWVAGISMRGQHERSYLITRDRFLDLLVNEGLLDRHIGMPTTLTVTAAGDSFIRSYLLEKEVKGGVKSTAEFLGKRHD